MHGKPNFLKVAGILIGMLIFTQEVTFAKLLNSKKSGQSHYILHTAFPSPLKEILTARIKEAFRRMHATVDLQIAPSSQRALMLANQEGDGDPSRVTNILTIAPNNASNLIQVPEPIEVLELRVYTKDPTINITNWDSLKNYRNGARLGAKIIETNLPDKKVLIPHTDQLFKMLDSGRLDTVVEWSRMADHSIQKLKLKDIKKRPSLLSSQNFHIYLHKKHRSLVPGLNKVLKQMKVDGTFEKVTKEFVFYLGPDKNTPEELLRKNVLTEIFKRLGLRLRTVTPGSSQRALFMANEEGDGDSSRIKALHKVAPKITGNLVRVPEAISELRFNVYTHNKDLKIDGFKSMTNLQNGLPTGYKVLEKRIPQNQVRLPDMDRLFQMLSSGRLDTVTSTPRQASKIIYSLKLKGIHLQPKPLLVLPGYPYLHKKNKFLVSAMAKTLKQMKEDGTYDRIEKEVIQTYKTR